MTATLEDGDSIEEEFKNYLVQASNIAPRNSRTSVLDDGLKNADDRQIQIIVRDINPETLAAALAGAGGMIQLRFFENLGSRGAALLYQDILYYKELADEDIIAAQKRVLKGVREGRDKV